MSSYQLGTVEAKFAHIIWANAPVSSAVLVKLCEETFQWKKSTTYTVLRRLCEKGLFANRDGVVTPLMTEAEFYANQSREYVAESFDGSLPAFLAAFTNGKKLKPGEIEEIQQMIDSFRGSKEG